ncbi:UDP-galactopyranose mutase [Oleisolibacter albus]|uniref:UDP-galactopyranose mutase n=1 Tax=Oleisolibacter albus TaxID=2171757 RepID=UPI001EFDE89B|nr:UDP-galactopyranose mutase [Oleisolibacter albus]
MSWAGPFQVHIGKSLRTGGQGSSTLPGSRVRHGDLVCFSHLRWSFVFQRPQHLMSRFARTHRVFFVEEPVPTDAPQPWLDVREEAAVEILVPRIPERVLGDTAETTLIQRMLLDRHFAAAGVTAPVLWYYTPMSLAYSDHLKASVIIYDCMDELSAFRGAPPELVERERILLGRADLVFTGGVSLYEAKRPLHHDVHAFPSSVDVAHFAAARRPMPDPTDQAAIPHPRVGFYGVIDERLDIALLDAVAAARPDLHFVMIGPVVKIDPAHLPRRPNIHYLGPKVYDELPLYLAGWDVAMMPFALNESTRFISPTKTPEYLAAGRPVVSTPVTDVVRGYGDSGVVHIAGDGDGFVRAIDTALDSGRSADRLQARIDLVLSSMSWDSTWQRMVDAIARAQTRAADNAILLRRPPTQRPALVEKRSRRTGFDYLIVGAGFAGSVLAERLASQLGKRVLIIDKRPHIAGNAYDCHDGAGLLIHRYGPHIFHTNSTQVAEYLSRFTEWRPYQHRVLAKVRDQLVPIPINLTTLNRLYGLELDEAGAARFLAERAEAVPSIRTSEDVVVSQVGRELYETFFRGYTRKQWGVDPAALDKAVTARVPTRTNTDDRYFTDSFQNMPKHGYTRMFERMLDHPNIKIMLNTDFAEIRNEVQYEKLIYSGPIDEFFDYRFGKLPYRSLTFRHETLEREWLQPVAVVNYPAEDVSHTRITEYKHLTGQQNPRTSITYEFPSAEGDPYYPVPRAENAELYRRYQALADATPNVTFVGRLGTYRYYNMDQVVAQALSVFNRIAAAEQTGTGLRRAAQELRAQDRHLALGADARPQVPAAE